MKKFLSLVLALAMAMSLVVVNTSAAEYTDDQDITYDEAVDVISEIGIVEGYTDGNFNPTNGLTRGAAAKIICNLILGPTTAAELHATTAPYSDVSINNEFAGYIAYCSQQGIISGYADGTFRPANPLTGYAFMKMLLGALGYDQYTEGYVGDNWSIQVAKQAIGIGLNNGLTEDFDGTDYVTREEACLYALNTLQADLVEYDTVITTTINGETVTIGNSIPHSQTWGSSATRRDNIKQDNYIQFAEEYFNRLVKADDADDFMRPAYTWTYAGTEIGTYVDWTLMVDEYTTEVSGSELYNLLTNSTIRDYDLYYYVDGADASAFNTLNEIEKNDLYRTNNNTVGETENGVLTQVFVDDDDREIVITSINTYLAKATSDYNSTRETITLEVYYGANGTNNTSITKTVDVEAVPAIADLSEGDFLLLNWADADVSERSKDVVSIGDVEIMEDVTVSRFSKDRNDTSASQGNADRVTQVTVGGEEYDNSAKAYYSAATLGDYDGDLLTDKTYTVYLDQYGYFIGVELFSGDDQYVFISAYDVPTSALGAVNAEALAVFTDGTLATITVNRTATNNKIDGNDDNDTSNYPGYTLWDADSRCNRWFTYTVNNDVYTLTPVDSWTLERADNGTDITVQTDRLSLAADEGTGRSYGNEDSVYITVEQDGVGSAGAVIDEVTGVYTGIQDVRLNVAQNQWIIAVYDDDHYIIAAIVWGEAEGAVDNYAYILSGAKSEARDDDGYYYWTFDAILNGEVQTLTIKSRYENTIDNLDVDAVQELVLDGDGYVTKINRLSETSTWGTVDANNRWSDAAHYYRNVDGANEVYTNEDMNNGTSVSTFDVYDIMSNSNTLYLTGRTLHRGETLDETGLFTASDAPAVVRQWNNGSWSNTEYSTVASAYSTLTDRNDNMPGLQFYGRVVAVMDSNGVAQWVFFYDYDQTPSGTTNYPGSSSGITLNSLQASAGVGGEPVVTVTSNSNVSTATNGYMATVNVTTASGAQVYTGTGLTIMDNSATLANSYTIDLAGYLGTATPGEYVVTVTVLDGTTTVASASGTLAIL